jgi:hypothetical protein
MIFMDVELVLPGQHQLHIHAAEPGLTAPQARIKLIGCTTT